MIRQSSRGPGEADGAGEEGPGTRLAVSEGAGPGWVAKVPVAGPFPRLLVGVGLGHEEPGGTGAG
jgi:hypothetical protein